MGKYRVRPGRFIPALFILAGVVTLVAWGTWCTLAWAKNSILLHLLEIRTLAREETRKVRAVEGLVIRQEEPVKAGSAGALQMLAEDGQKLRVGNPLASIQGVTGETTVVSPSAGVFCSHLDELENLLNPGTVDVLDMEAVEKIITSANAPGPSGEVAGGQIIGKVVDNLQPVLVYIHMENPDKSAATSFTKGAAVSLAYKGRELTGKVTEMRSAGDILNIFVEVDNYPEIFIHQRQVQLELVTRHMEGWLVPEEAIVFKEGKPGIYVISKQFITWLPVAVHDRLNGMVEIEGKNLNNLVRYIANPGWAREGVRLGIGG